MPASALRRPGDDVAPQPMARAFHLHLRRHPPASQSCTMRRREIMATFEIRGPPTENEALHCPTALPPFRCPHQEPPSQILGVHAVGKAQEGADHRSPFPAAGGSRCTERLWHEPEHHSALSSIPKPGAFEPAPLVTRLPLTSYQSEPAAYLRHLLTHRLTGRFIPYLRPLI